MNVWSAPISFNFCFTNDSALAASASYKAIELSGLEGRAGIFQKRSIVGRRYIPTLRKSLGVLPVVADNNDMCDLGSVFR